MTARNVLVPAEATVQMLEDPGVDVGLRTIRKAWGAMIAASPNGGRVPREIALGMMNAMWNIGLFGERAGTIEEAFMRFLGLEVAPEGSIEFVEAPDVPT